MPHAKECGLVKFSVQMDLEQIVRKAILKAVTAICMYSGCKKPLLTIHPVQYLAHFLGVINYLHPVSISPGELTKSQCLQLRACKISTKKNQ